MKDVFGLFSICVETTEEYMKIGPFVCDDKPSDEIIKFCIQDMLAKKWQG